MGDISLSRPHNEFTCPQCGWSGAFELRFPAWCLACTYGAEDGLVLKTLGRRAERGKAAATKRGDRLYARVAAADQLRPTGLLRTSGLAVAGLIHLVTVSVFACGVALLVDTQPGSLAWVLGPVVIWLAFTLLPRFPKMDRGGDLITRAQAPELFRLLDQIAQSLKTASFSGVRLTATANAATSVFGPGERLLEIGVPLWELLSPQQRLAVLAHEVAHGANSDTEYGFVVRSALYTLRRWYAVTHPLTLVTRRTRLRTRNVVDVILPFHIFYRGATALLLRSKPRAEYLADALAAQVASTGAMVEALERMVTASVAMQVLANAVEARVPSNPWRIVRDFAAALPEYERTRLALLNERAGASVDDTHPPTHLRIRLLRAGRERPARLTLTTERSAAIDAELADRINELGTRLSKFARR